MRKLTAGVIGIVSTAFLYAPSTVVPAATNPIFHAPRIAQKVPDNGHGHGHGGSGGSGGSFGWASSNWSGYAVSTGTYGDITGQWTVPSVAPSKKQTYSSSWIGIDGFNNSDLIQTGTEQDYYTGSAHYNAWWEILPAAETPLDTTQYPVNPGDVMTAHIHNNGDGTWTITLNDNHWSQPFQTTQSYSGPASSAEWIQEAPTIGGHVATLANYGSTTFDPGTVNGKSPNLTMSDGGVMDQNRTQVSTPSQPDSDTDGFAVQYGSTMPSAPAS